MAGARVRCEAERNGTGASGDTEGPGAHEASFFGWKCNTRFEPLERLRDRKVGNAAGRAEPWVGGRVAAGLLGPCRAHDASRPLQLPAQHTQG